MRVTQPARFAIRPIGVVTWLLLIWVSVALIPGAAAQPDRVVAIGSEEFRQLVDKLAASNRQGCVALKGEILLEVDGQKVLVR